MAGNKGKYSLKLSEVLLILFVFFSGVMLAFSSGGFVLNFRQIGFSVVSSFEKGVFNVVSGIGSSFNAIKELAQLKKDYDELTVKLADFEQMRRSNAEIRKENERLITKRTIDNNG